MGNLDRFAKFDSIVIGASKKIAGTGMLCFFTGHRFPPFCAPMRRSPEPPVGQLFDSEFHRHFSAALDLNPAVHDGAIMIGRDFTSQDYSIKGWSFRLFPPEVDIEGGLNRGSAFNSCAAMSRTPEIDIVYLWSGNHVWRFLGGIYLPIYVRSAQEPLQRSLAMGATE